MPAIQFLVERRESGDTVAAMLRKRFQLTWTQAKRLVEKGHIRIAGQLTRAPEQRVRTGNRVWIAAGVIELAPGVVKPQMPEKPKPQKVAEPKKIEKKRPDPVIVPNLDIVYQDDDIVVVNKPAGWTTVRNREDIEEFGKRAKKFLPKTLAEVLPTVLGTTKKPVIAVHRLDRDTTGLLVFARNSEAADHLNKQFRKHSIDRKYWALTRGTPTERRIESTFVRDRGDGRRGSTTVADAPDGKTAITFVKPLETYGDFAWVECRLETGRTHQVRIHLGEAGFPLCGESVYDRDVDGNRPPDSSRAKRPMLHAVRIGLVHPTTHERLVWEVEPPNDFVKLQQQFQAQQTPQES